MIAGRSPLTGAMVPRHCTVMTIRGSDVHRFPPASEQARREFGEIPERIGDGAGAVPSSSGSGDVVINVPSQDDGMSLTDILLIVLVVLILVMAIIVALRLMRS